MITKKIKLEGFTEDKIEIIKMKKLEDICENCKTKFSFKYNNTKYCSYMLFKDKGKILSGLGYNEKTKTYNLCCYYIQQNYNSER